MSYMPNIKYHYAYDETDRIVSIGEISADMRHQHTYRCIGCGATMVPKLGAVRAAHFSHKAESDGCGAETYLHRLAKKLVKARFEESIPFEIAYHRDVKCSNQASCAFFVAELCHERQQETFDLKKYYDTCEEEKEINGYVADLLLTNSRNPSAAPVLIEIQVSHASELTKIESGLRIIEIRIKEEDDIKQILSGVIKDHPDNWIENVSVRDVDTIGYAKFYGFKPESTSPKRLTRNGIVRFCLYTNGSAHIVTHMDCSIQMKRSSAHSILELNFDSSTLTENAYNCGYAIALNKGFKFKSCSLCRYRKGAHEMATIFTEGPNFCCLYKSKGTPKWPESKYAAQCEFYHLDVVKMREVNHHLSTVKYTVVP